MTETEWILRNDIQLVVLVFVPDSHFFTNKHGLVDQVDVWIEISYMCFQVG